MIGTSQPLWQSWLDWAWWQSWRQFLYSATADFLTFVSHPCPGAWALLPCHHRGGALKKERHGGKPQPSPPALGPELVAHSPEDCFFIHKRECDSANLTEWFEHYKRYWIICFQSHIFIIALSKFSRTCIPGNSRNYCKVKKAQCQSLQHLKSGPAEGSTPTLPISIWNK